MSPRTHQHSLTPEERRERMRRTHEQLNAAVEDLTTADGWRAMVRSRAWLRRYSLNNLLLILTQHPGASDVRPFREWKRAGRYVRKGERGIRILAPIRYKVEPDDGEDDGAPGYAVRAFKTTTVFDVSQTDGDPLPPQATQPVPEELNGTGPEHLWEDVAACVTEQGYTLERGDCDSAYGWVHYPSRTVRVRDDVSLAQATKTLVHELAHILADHETRTVSRARCEVEAESVACLVSAMTGLDTLGYSVPYVAGWAETADEAHQAAGTVLDVADRITARLLEHAPAPSP